jgi:superoxide dismutase, Fe-Mn family
MYTKVAFYLSLCAVLFKASVAVAYPNTFQAETRTYTAKEFHNLQNVRGLSPNLIELHLNLYRGYVKNTNAIAVRLKQLLRTSRSISPSVTALRKQLSWEYNGMRLHELYFENMAYEPLNPDGNLADQIERDFGSIENWQRDFESAGLTRGIGWVVLYYDVVNRRLSNAWIEEHNIGPLVSNLPIVVMDVWEHAYLTQYGLNRSEYIRTFIKNISWIVCEKRFKQAEEG